MPQRFPELNLSTPRLLIRRLLADDAKQIAEILADRQTRRWLPVMPPADRVAGHRVAEPVTEPRAEEVAEDIAEGRVEELAADWCTTIADERRRTGAGDHYGVVRREDGELVGCLWVKRTDWAGKVTELSYAIAPDARGLGFATEATTAVAVDLIGEYGFERIELRIAPGNVDSRRVAEKAGFTYEGLLRNAGYVHTGRVDLEVWSLIAPDLRAPH